MQDQQIIEQNLEIIDIEPCHQHAAVLSSVWSSSWPVIASKAGYTQEQIITKLQSRSIPWWIEFIKIMSVAFYVKDSFNNTGIFYLMNDHDLCNFLQIDHECWEHCATPNVHMFIEKSSWGSQLSTFMHKIYAEKRRQKGFNQNGAWIMKSNARSLAAIGKFSKKGYWIKKYESATPVWESNIDFEYWLLDNQNI
jgi:hypothetical protein